MYKRPSLRIQRYRISTCSLGELEIKTGKFLFFVKQSDKVFFVYFLSFGIFLVFRSEQRLTPTSQPRSKGCRAAIDSSSRDFARVDLLQQQIFFSVQLKSEFLQLSSSVQLGRGRYFSQCRVQKWKPTKSEFLTLVCTEGTDNCCFFMPIFLYANIV